MTLSPAQFARFTFLTQVVQKECAHLTQTDHRLWNGSFTLKQVEDLATTPDLSERVDAFASRFGRLQDTLGDKLLPHLLHAMGERTSAAIDNLDRAEQLGWLNTEAWMRMRQLRNQMIHEYIVDPALLFNALNAGHEFVPNLIATANSLINEVQRRGFMTRTAS